MSHYRETLVGMHRLLIGVRQNHWASWIAQDIVDWDTIGATSHHLEAYGGMGSFNDVILSANRAITVEQRRDVWVSTFFEWLKLVCYALARNPSTVVGTDGKQKEGTLDPIRAAIRWPDTISGPYHSPSARLTLQGRHCRTCSLSVVTPYEIEQYLANEMVPPLIYIGLMAHRLTRVVDRVLAYDIDGLENARSEVSSLIAKSDINVLDDDVRMIVCPRCGSDEIVNYWWQRSGMSPVFESVLPSPPDLGWTPDGRPRKTWISAMLGWLGSRIS